MSKLFVDEYNSGRFQHVINCDSGENLYEVLTRNGVGMKGAVCKGAGICRGCQVYIVEEGMECLACRYEIGPEDLHIVCQGRPAEQSVLLTNHSDTTSSSTTSSNTTFECTNDINVQYGIAFDIGTTTIASSFVDLESGRILSEQGCMNRQSQFGADVISRIQYASSNPDGLNTMHRLICADIEALIQSYVEQGYRKEQMKKLVFSGNTTMLHFLMNRSVNGLTGFPFAPEFLDGQQYEYDDMLIEIMPGKSAFVGADIVSGVQALNLGCGPEYELLIDLGTNGELWLLNEEQGVCTSTSCGPAFANSVTKGNVYGTCLLDELAKAYIEGKIDSNGLLQGKYFEKGISCGEIIITQDTVRQIQLAKAAIRTGIELAAYELRIPLENISKVYLAGGFGFFLNLESAFTIGLLPDEFRGRITTVGNTSLKGAIQTLSLSEPMLRLPTRLENSKVLDLSMSKNFQEFFLHRIPFPKL